MFRLFADERNNAVQPLQQALNDLKRKVISPTKREILYAAVNYFINRVASDNLIRTLTTDYQDRTDKLAQLCQATNLRDDDFIAETRRTINQLPEGSTFKDSLSEACNTAQMKLIARRKNATNYALLATASVTIFSLITNTRAGLALIAIELCATLYSAPVKQIFDDAVELLDTILSTEFSNNNQPRSSRSAYAYN